MVEQISAHHEKEYKARPSVVVSVPGKMDLFGEHGEYGKGSVLSLGIDRRFYVAVSRRQDNSLRFYSANLNERKKSSISALKFKREDRWANYCKGVIDALQQKGGRVQGMNLTLFSEVPMGIGLASSSAMVVATAVAVKTLFDLDIPDYHLIEAASWSERRFMGIHEGLSSPMVCYYAREGQLCLLDILSLQVQFLPFPSGELTLLATDSQVSESMSDREKAEIDVACRECEEVMEVKHPGHLLRAVSKNDLSSTIEGLSERSRRICLHLLKENARIGDFRKFLESGSYDMAGRLMVRSHESLRDYLEISCPELDWLTRRAVETEGVYGARMIGGGYGGCTVTLMNAGAVNSFEARLEDYDRIFGFKASTFPVLPGPGAQIHLAETPDS